MKIHPHRAETIHLWAALDLHPKIFQKSLREDPGSHCGGVQVDGVVIFGATEVSHLELRDLQGQKEAELLPRSSHVCPSHLECRTTYRYDHENA